MNVGGRSAEPPALGTYHSAPALLPGELTGAREKAWAEDEEGEQGED